MKPHTEDAKYIEEHTEEMKHIQENIEDMKHILEVEHLCSFPCHLLPLCGRHFIFTSFHNELCEIPRA